MIRRHCSSCSFAKASNLYDTYECRRHSPIHKEREPWNANENVRHSWPMVRGGDWCGDYKKGVELDPILQKSRRSVPTD